MSHSRCLRTMDALVTLTCHNNYNSRFFKSLLINQWGAWPYNKCAILFLVRLKGNIYPDHHRTYADSGVNKHPLRQDKLKGSLSYGYCYRQQLLRAPSKRSLSSLFTWKLCFIIQLQCWQLGENNILTVQKAKFRIIKWQFIKLC